ncbi:MAG TPA: hypothetical protein VNE62_02965 [Actinomycetota bacterium]|nr:hypothetical protein [Actinomycetota bacterium]
MARLIFVVAVVAASLFPAGRANAFFEHCLGGPIAFACCSSIGEWVTITNGPNGWTVGQTGLSC